MSEVGDAGTSVVIVVSVPFTSVVIAMNRSLSDIPYSLS